MGVSDVLAWESEHGRLPPGAVLLAHTGRGAHYADREEGREREEEGGRPASSNFLFRQIFLSCLQKPNFLNNFG